VANKNIMKQFFDNPMIAATFALSASGADCDIWRRRCCRLGRHSIKHKPHNIRIRSRFSFVGYVWWFCQSSVVADIINTERVKRMHKLLFVMIICLIPVVVSASDLVIQLKKEPLNLGNVNFYVDDIIDSRADKDNIGTARTGAFNLESIVNLEGGFKPALMDFLIISFPGDDNKIPVVLNILDFSVNEKMVFLAEKAEAKATIEFYSKKDDELIKLFKADSYVKQTSSVDCTKFHESNIRDLLKESFKAFVSSGMNPTTAKEGQVLLTRDEILNQSNPVNNEKEIKDERKLYYEYAWKGTGEISASYGFTCRGYLFQYRRENVLGHHSNHTNTYSYSIGYSNIKNSNIDVTYSNNMKFSGKYSADILPVSLCVHRRVNSGFWRGRWGIGLTGYYYSGKIDMVPLDTVYNGNGLGINIVLPGELVVGSSKHGD